MAMDADPSNNQHGPQVDMEDVRQLVTQVKDEIQRCLDAYMTKERMFQELRKKGIQLEIAIAVYKELRAQNKDFFKAYYSMMDLNRQIQRFNLLLDNYSMMQQQSKTSSSHVPNQGGVEPSSSSAARPCTLSATTQPMAVPDTAWPPNHQAGPVWQDHSQPSASGGVNGVAAWPPSQPMVYLPAMQDAGHLQQLANGWGVAQVPSAADPSNAFMGGSWPPPQAGAWHAAGQPLSLQQLQYGGSFRPSWGSPSPPLPLPPLPGAEQLPPLPGEEQLPENQIYQSYVASRGRTL